MTARNENSSKLPFLFKGWRKLTSPTLALLILLIALFLSDDLARHAVSGFNLALRVILPSIFPFLILTDIAIRFITFENNGSIRNLFERIFKVNKSATSVFICGILCGFPIGAKLALDMYDCGAISKDECERLMAFSNNPSPGYIIASIGINLRGSLADGIILYTATVISAILTGIIISKGKKASLSQLSVLSNNKFSFVDSVKRAALISLNICAFITTFSIFSGLFKSIAKSDTLLYIFSPFLELSNASTLLSKSPLPSQISLLFIAFALGFNGLCVYAQTKSLVHINLPLSSRHYLSYKLLQGCVSLIITFLIILIRSAFFT